MSGLERFTNTVNGQETASRTGRWLVSEDPFTGKPWAEVPHCDADDARAASRPPMPPLKGHGPE